MPIIISEGIAIPVPILMSHCNTYIDAFTAGFAVFATYINKVNPVLF